MERFHRRAAAIALLLAFLALDAVVAAEAPADLSNLPGHVPPRLAGARGVEPSPRGIAPSAEESIELTVVLRRSDPAGFESYLREVYDPRSPRFRRFLSPREVSDRFGPGRADYDAVSAWFAGQGFTITSDSVNRMTMTVSSTRSLAEAALGVAIDDYVFGERSFFANDRDPALPADIAQRVQAVVGLASLARPRPAYAAYWKFICGWRGRDAGSGVTTATSGLVGQALAQAQEAACNAAVDNCAAGKLNANDTAAVKRDTCKKFNPDPAPATATSVLFPHASSAAPDASIPRGAPTPWKDVDGTGQTVGITAFDTFLESDVADYLDLFGMPETTIDNLSQVHVNGGAALGANASEVLLDVDTVLMGAPGAQVVVYDAPFTGAGSFQALFNRMIDDGVTIISNSWAYCESQTTLADVESIDSILQTAAASGITVLNAAGDSGSTCLDGSANTVAVPAGSPHATAVGGTSLVTGPGAIHDSESWWNGAGNTPPTGQGGFGVSAFFARPAYQDGFHASPMRSVPDIAFNADPAQGVVICQASAGGCPAPLSWGGTSVAAPSWAAGVALLNQALGQNLGHLGPSLYPLAASGAFHTPAELGSDFAHVGLGAPKFNALLLALQDAVPGPVSASVSRVRLIEDRPPADGSSTAEVVVWLRDASGNSVRGKTVTLEADPGSSAVVTPPSGVSNEGNGAVVFEVTNTVAEVVALTATDVTDGIVLDQTVEVVFIAPPAASGGIAALPTTVAADGVSTTTITVTLLDGDGMGAAGKEVTLSQGAGRSVVSSPSPATTDADGEIAFTATNRYAETVTYTAIDVTDGNLPVPGAAMVMFTNASPQPCPLAEPVAGPGWSVSSFVTSLPFGFFGGCGGAAGLAFDRARNLFVTNVADGHLYKFGPAGGVANAATRVTTTPYPLGWCVQGLAWSKDGEHLYMARQGCGVGGEVLEISPIDGQVIRTLASGTLCATGLATDPVSGDLFVSSPCPPGGPGMGGVGHLYRIHDPESATPTVTPFSSPGHAQGLVFTPDGTLWATPLRFDLSPDRRDIVKIAGTASPNPGEVTVLLSQVNGDPLFVATNAVPVLDPGDPGNPEALFVVNGNGGLHRLDLDQVPPVRTTVATGGDVVIIMIGGPDGCLYFDDMDRVVRVTDDDGSCNFAPTTAAPTLVLAPGTAAPIQGGTQTVTAHLLHTEAPQGTPIYFTIFGPNDQVRLGRTDAAGRASIEYPGVRSGTDVVRAHATLGAETVSSNEARIDWAEGEHTSFLSLRGAIAGTAGTPVSVSAVLADVSQNPFETVAGATVEFSVSGQMCSDTTDAAGVASCNVTPPAPGVFTLLAQFDGSAQLLPSSDSELFLVQGEPPICAADCYDVDLDGQVLALTDGLLILRYLFGLTGTTLVNGALAVGATRTDPVAIVTYLDSIRDSLLDLDGNGQEAALSDGLLLLRYFFGLRAAVLIAAAVGGDCTRCDAASIEGFIVSVLGG